MENSAKPLVRWPDGNTTSLRAGYTWLQEAHAAGVSIPTGCLGGSCGACEIEVNGEILRACIALVPEGCEAMHEVHFTEDPYW